MKTPINNNLDNLFNKAKADEQNLDDFEKEAMVGFNMLESEKEAFDLKANLDARINKELFNKEEKNNPKIYWLAAAGLALIIGLSTLFVINDTNKNNNLAITDTQKESLPETGGELKEEALLPLEKIITDSAPAKDVLEKQKAAESDDIISNLETKVSKEGQKPNARMIVAASPNNEQSAEGKSELEKTERKNEAGKLGWGTHTQSDQTTSSDDLAKKGNLKDKESDLFKAQTTVAAPVQTQKVSQSESVPADEIAAGKASKLDRNDYKNKDGYSEKNLDQVALGNNATVTTNREESKAKEKSAKSRAKQSNSTAAGPETIDNKPGSPKSTTKSLETEEVTVAEVEDKKDENNFINCYYSGGEAAITKDIKEKLIEKNLNQKFDATLFVNEKKEVQKVEFINSYDLTKKQKEEVTKILKSLNKFNFFVSPTKKSEFTYKVLYRP
ncbi:MAG: hypothetical protein Q8T03_15110 [Bacteroidota bacterium]|nr:hypothetical protein [Bacteroidota bacterium]